MDWIFFFLWLQSCALKAKWNPNPPARQPTASQQRKKENVVQFDDENENKLPGKKKETEQTFCSHFDRFGNSRQSLKNYIFCWRLYFSLLELCCRSIFATKTFLPPEKERSERKNEYWINKNWTKDSICKSKKSHNYSLYTKLHYEEWAHTRAFNWILLCEHFQCHLAFQSKCHAFIIYIWSRIDGIHILMDSNFEYSNLN